MEQENSLSDINSKIADYSEIISGFISLLQEENQALTDYDMEKVSSLLEQKNKIVVAYRSMVAYFIKNQEELNIADEQAKKQLKDLSVKLDAEMKRNDTLLKTRMETSQSVMDSIVRIAKVTTASNATSYGAQGKYAPVDNLQSSLAINRTL